MDKAERALLIAALQLSPSATGRWTIAQAAPRLRAAILGAPDTKISVEALRAIDARDYTGVKREIIRRGIVFRRARRLARDAAWSDLLWVARHYHVTPEALRDVVLSYPPNLNSVGEFWRAFSSVRGVVDAFLQDNLGRMVAWLEGLMAIYAIEKGSTAGNFFPELARVVEVVAEASLMDWFEHPGRHVAMMLGLREWRLGATLEDFDTETSAVPIIFLRNFAATYGCPAVLSAWRSYLESRGAPRQYPKEILRLLAGIIEDLGDCPGFRGTAETATEDFLREEQLRREHQLR